MRSHRRENVAFLIAARVGRPPQRALPAPSRLDLLHPRFLLRAGGSAAVAAASSRSRAATTSSWVGSSNCRRGGGGSSSRCRRRCDSSLAHHRPGRDSVHVLERVWTWNARPRAGRNQEVGRLGVLMAVDDVELLADRFCIKLANGGLACAGLANK